MGAGSKASRTWSSSLWTRGTGILPWLVRWACHVGTRDFYFALGALVSPVQNIFSSPYTIFQILCPNRPASWAGSRAGSPVSLYVSLIRHWCLVSSFFIVSYGPCHKVFNIFYVLIKRLNLISAVLIIFGCILKISLSFS